ncbi:hypothetical protein LY78DRAFT_446677 [Colletotrichum sublineola]|nr:hypothetical protein LY78DRAFT_446677 [Colletotrichum sublineola]
MALVPSLLTRLAGRGRDRDSKNFHKYMQEKGGPLELKTNSTPFWLTFSFARRPRRQRLTLTCIWLIYCFNCDDQPFSARLEKLNTAISPPSLFVLGHPWLQ